MECSDCKARLDAYLDGELSAEEMRELSGHVNGCPVCAAQVLQRVQRKRMVQAAGRRYVPSSEFRERVRASITVGRQPAWRRAWATAVALALVVLGFFFAYQRQQRGAGEQIFSELADLHVSTLASPNPVDVVSTDRHTVKPWFEGKIPFTFDLPELPNTDFALLGGRIVYLGQSPGAELIYQRRKHLISVFIFQKRAVGAAEFSQAPNRQTGSFTTETWEDGNLRYVVVGDVTSEDIHHLAELLKRAARE